MSDDGAFDKFMGGGAKTFPFDNVGDQVTGRILSITERQSTDMQTGEPSFWPDGKPKMLFTIELATELREDDEDDDGVRSIHIRWKSQEAVRNAVKASGAKKPDIGGILTLKFTGEGPRTKNGFNPPKFWAAHYIPPDPTANFMDSAPDSAALGVRAGSRLPEGGQARNVDHQGRPQSQQPPDWAIPQGQAAQEVGQRLIEQQRAGSARLAGSDYQQDERQKFGY